MTLLSVLKEYKLLIELYFLILFLAYFRILVYWVCLLPRFVFSSHCVDTCKPNSNVPINWELLLHVLYKDSEIVHFSSSWRVENIITLTRKKLVDQQVYCQPPVYSNSIVGLCQLLKLQRVCYNCNWVLKGSTTIFLSSSTNNLPCNTPHCHYQTTTSLSCGAYLAGDHESRDRRHLPLFISPYFGWRVFGLAR